MVLLRENTNIVQENLFKRIFLNTSGIFSAMRILHLYAKSKNKVLLPDHIVTQIPPNYGLVAAIQEVDSLKEIQQQLNNAVIAGQILGCRQEQAQEVMDKVDGFLYIGTGYFHPIGLYLTTKMPILCYNPQTQQVTPLEQSRVDEFLNIKKKAKLRFLKAENVGIIVSSKTGQNGIASAMRLKKRTDKKFFIFAVDTLNYNELQNFPWIECWVNTACPRIADEKNNVVNIADVREFLNLEKFHEDLDVNQLRTEKGIKDNPDIIIEK